MLLTAPLSHAGRVSTLKWPDHQGTKPWAGFKDMAVGRKHALAIYFPYPGRTMKESESSGTHVCIRHWLFLWVADAPRCLADTEHKAASTPRSTIATAVLGLLGPGFVSLWQCSSGWPAGCSPQIACGIGTGPLRTCQREDHWSRVGTQQFPAGTLRSLCLFTTEVAAGPRNSRKGRRGGESYGTPDMFVIFLICVVHLAYYPTERQGAFDF